jgi:hypothetical protein
MTADFVSFMGALGGDVTPFESFDVTNLQNGDTANYRS